LTLTFIEEFKGETWLEVFLLKGASSEEKHIRELSSIVRWLNPSKTQLNTIARPPCEKYAEGLSSQELKYLCKCFSGKVEAIADFKGGKEEKSFFVDESSIINLLKRRPCTGKEISDSLDLNFSEVLKLLEHLCSEGTAICEENNGKLYYKINSGMLR